MNNHPEKEFENKIKKYLKSKNCWFVKTFSDGMQRSGIPDILVCTPNGKFVAIEVKSEVGKLSPLQEYNIGWINRVGGWAICLKPSQFEWFKVEFESRFLQ